MLLAVARMIHGQLTSAWKTWQRHVWVGLSEVESQAAELQRQLQLMVAQRKRGILMRMQRLTLASAWRGWSAFVQKRHRIRKLMLRMQNRQAYMVFDCWMDFVEERRRQRLLVDGFISRWSNTLLRTGLFTWKLWTKDARIAETVRRTELQRLRSVVGRIQRRSISRAFDSWYALLCQRRRLRSFGAVMLHRQPRPWHCKVGWISWIPVRSSAA